VPSAVEPPPVPAPIADAEQGKDTKKPAPTVPVPPPVAQAPPVVPPVGALPPAGSPTIPVPMAPEPSPAKVPVREVRPFKATAELNTMEKISQHFYGDEKYAEALFAYNKALGPSSYFRDDSPYRPSLVGEVVLVPERDVLEKNYVAEIGNHRPRPETVPMIDTHIPTPGPTAAAPPPPPVATTPALQPPAPLASAADGAKTYTVQGNGEMLYEIARRTLGSGKDWTDIFNLNRDKLPHPERPIPAGTVLQLPPAAHAGP
jgi:nucleoid-associated protein YgaU